MEGGSAYVRLRVNSGNARGIGLMSWGIFNGILMNQRASRKHREYRKPETARRERGILHTGQI